MPSLRFILSIHRGIHGIQVQENKQYGGEGGIRTLGTGVSPYNGLANRRIRPLCHLSGGFTVYHGNEQRMWKDGSWDRGFQLRISIFTPRRRRILFVIRNAKESAMNLQLPSWTMPSILRGERSGSGRLPELWRYGIRGEASGLE